MASRKNTRIHFQFADSRDAARVAQLVGTLRAAGYSVGPPDHVAHDAGGQVRFFFPQDEQAAGNIKLAVQSNLAREGTALRIDTLALDAKRPANASPGRVEVLLPSLSTPVAAAPSPGLHMTAE